MSIVKHKEQRVGVFIDTQNLYHSAKNLYGHKVNFANIVKDAVADRKLVRSIAYVIASDSGEEGAFFDALNKNGIETRVKDLQHFASGAKKADWDVGLAVDAITMAPKLDAVVVLSGDGDFVPMVEYLQVHSGIQVEFASFGETTSQMIKESVNDFINLSDNPERYLIGYRPKTPRRKKSSEGHGKRAQGDSSSKAVKKQKNK